MTVRQAFAAIPQSVYEVSLPEMWTEFENTPIRGTLQTFQLHLTRNFDDVSIMRFDAIPRGGNRFDLPDDLKAPCWIKHTTGSADVMGRLHWDRPSGRFAPSSSSRKRVGTCTPSSTAPSRCARAHSYRGFQTHTSGVDRRQR